MDSIKTVLLTQKDSGGAGIATRRIHEGLQEIGINSQMLVRDRSSDDSTIHAPESRFSQAITKIRPLLDNLPLIFYGSPDAFSISWAPDRLYKRVNKLNPDIVHLNWIAKGYMSPESINKFDCPVVWRLPDMWPLTGGCHYAGDCDRYRSGCGNCPQLDSNMSWDPSRITLKRKKRAVEQQDLTVVATTSWLAKSASESEIFENTPIEIIPNGLDTDVFKQYETQTGRDLFNLPSESKLILFGAVGALNNPRKGFDLFKQAIANMSSEDREDIEIVVFGASEPEDPPEFELPVHYTGYLSDEEALAVLYAAADVMVVPSRYEGFGQTVSEAMSSGTPVVAFETTGPKEILDHKQTGYLASKFSPTDLANGIKWVIDDSTRQSTIGDQARLVAQKNYDQVKIAEKYKNLYESLL
jgi:glycosyltransferase involved in cell wall biosynthesis